MKTSAAIATRMPRHLERAVAVAASVDPRTVRSVLDGRATRPMPRERIVRVIRDLGLQRYLPRGQT